MDGSKKRVKVPILRALDGFTSGKNIIRWFDGGAQQNGEQSGAGRVIKISEHSSYKWTINCGHRTNIGVELMGVWDLLTLASRFSISEILVLGDSKIVIDWLKGKGSLKVVTLKCWKERITYLIKMFRDISFGHVYQEDNQEADQLSKKVLLRHLGYIAYYLCEEGHEGPTIFLSLY